VIDKHGGPRHACERPILSKGDSPQIVVVADAGENKIAASRSSRRRCARSAARAGPFGGRVRRSVINDDVVTGSRQMPRHRETHDPKPQKRNFAQPRPLRFRIGQEYKDICLPATDLAQAGRFHPPVRPIGGDTEAGRRGAATVVEQGEAGCARA
jgi:hypothetical protein